VEALAAVLGGAASLAAAIYWIVALAEIARTPAWQFEAVDSNKVFWIFVVLAFSVVGAVCWLLFRREHVLSAEGRDDPEAPADWYLDEEAGSLRWWDGYEWTERYQTWSGARPAHSA
jgi:drug/metabolite transporter (DMT)-like permease